MSDGMSDKTQNKMSDRISDRNYVCVHMYMGMALAQETGMDRSRGDADVRNEALPASILIWTLS